MVCPHGHVDPGMFADPDYRFGTPTDLLISPDHYVFRMLYSHGIPLEKLGISATPHQLSDQESRQAWQIFADYFHLFHGTPTGIWLREELIQVFGVDQKLDGDSAQEIYNQVEARLHSPSCRPRQLYDQFNIEVLCTTNSATDTLQVHQQIRDSGWHGRILPTFRPDSVINLDAPGWIKNIHILEDITGRSIDDYPSFITALETRRADFKAMGATATDHAVTTALTLDLSPQEANAIFQRALAGQAAAEDTIRFTAHMMVEMARMSTEDGLVMQLHVGSWRNHNSLLYARYGPDKGADIPIAGEFTRSLQPLLQKFGSDPRLTLVLFTLDESTYARELAPLAGHYPALKIGPPWWFHDSINGMRRYFDQVMETAGIYNTTGFNDDTRSYPSISSRHDVWRRASCDWVAGLLVRHIVDEREALQMVRALAYDLAKQVYRL